MPIYRGPASPFVPKQAVVAQMRNGQTPAMPGKDAAELREELGRQYRILMKDAPVRLAATTIAYGMTTPFLPWPIVLLCFMINLSAEIISLRKLRGLDPAVNASRYRQCLTWVFILELSFSVVPGMMWHIEGPYMKAFAIGLALTSIMHVSTVRAIHLRMGFVALTAIGGTALISNALLWINKGDFGSLAFTTVCAVAGLGYAVGATVSNNQLHRETARGRAEAQAANAAKGTFLAQMSHELRTPLNAILGMGHAELRRTDDPVSLERLSVLISSAEGLSTILDDILDMSAIQGAHLPIRRAPINLRSEISATAALFRPQIEEAGLTLVTDLPVSLPIWVLLDAQRLRQCLSNLLSNALKNTAEGRISIRASRIEHGDAGSLLRIEVADTGPGIPAEHAAAIFEPFVRGPGTSLGTGLGLSITRALARQMGGDLQLEQPAPGAPSGAHFILTLALEETAAPKPAQPVATAPPIDLTGCSVLVVDDIASNRLVAVTYLRYFGATPIEASSGAEALRRIAAGGIDLVLLDMNMPEMDGLETFAALRALPSPAGQVAVIAMTANTLSDHRQLYRDAGIDGYLAKPVAPDSAAAEIRRVLRMDGPATA
jgi:two-component system, sensor histidine kinase